ncbi:hypothetical protein Leryth_022148 [Lithospermum erythrorhizon]|nr:hypothetical protein Leryth_022148 [Lithospermum erythrorhizon]
MAASTAPSASFSLRLPRDQRSNQCPAFPCLLLSKQRTRRGRSLRIFAVQTPDERKRAPPGVDTRIHWENEDEGWVGGSTSQSSAQENLNDEESIIGKKFSDLLNSSSDSHYQFLGVSAVADTEEIKAAYRRLSKEYHPDTTSLPLKAASEKFMRLREIYDVLSDGEKRKFYDWTLAQEAASREAEKMRMKLQDPYIQEVQEFESVPDMVDRLGGKNMELSTQAKTALTFDILIVLFSFCCIIYVLVFKEQY